MNSDARRLLRQYDPEPVAPYKYSYSTYATIIVFAVTLLYQAAVRRAYLPALPELLWDCLVFIIPSRLLYALDNWLNPSLFPTAMLSTQSRTQAAKSEVLRRIIGGDRPGGILTSVSQAGRKSLSGFSKFTAMAMKTTGLEPPAGLGNYNNSCYQNSILQALSSLRPLPDYLFKLISEGSGGTSGGPVESTASALSKLIAELNNPSNNGKTLWPSDILKNMSTWQQQDAQEYFSKLLDEIDKENRKAFKVSQASSRLEQESGADDAAASQHSDDDSGYLSSSSSSSAGRVPLLPPNPLEGLVAQRVACVACGYCEGLSMIPFNCITLNLGTDQSEHDVYERLDHYTKVESIEGVQCAKCSLLKVRGLIKMLLENNKGSPSPALSERLRAVEEALEEEDFEDKTLSQKCKISERQRSTVLKTKQTVFARPPQSLVFHMNRSVFDENTGHMFKNRAAVRFPMSLDLGPWCLGSASGSPIVNPGVSIAEEEAGKHKEEMEQWLSNARMSMVAGDKGRSKFTGPLYELRAVITHQGSHENGHYVCYRKFAEPEPANSEGPVDDLSNLDTEPETMDMPPQLASEATTTAMTSSKNCDDVSSSSEEGGEDSSPDSEKDLEDDQAKPEAKPRRSEWWRLSDGVVSAVNEEEVMRQGNVFMLFYDCVDPNPILTSEVEDFVDTAPDRDTSSPDETLNRSFASRIGEGRRSSSGISQVNPSALGGLSGGLVFGDAVATARAEAALEAQDSAELAKAMAMPLPLDDSD